MRQLQMIFMSTVERLTPGDNGGGSSTSLTPIIKAAVTQVVGADNKILAILRKNGTNYNVTTAQPVPRTKLDVLEQVLKNEQNIVAKITSDTEYTGTGSRYNVAIG